MGDDFWEDFADNEDARRIVCDLAALTEETAASRIGELIQRAREWRRKHVSVVD